MTNPHWPDIVLGTLIFLAAVTWIGATIMRAENAIKRFFAQRAAPQQVDVTLNQMYGDVRLEQQEGSSYRKSRHGIKGG